jgi:hypothetical protein
MEIGKFFILIAKPMGHGKTEMQRSAVSNQPLGFGENPGVHI